MFFVNWGSLCFSEVGTPLAAAPRSPVLRARDHHPSLPLLTHSVVMTVAHEDVDGEPVECLQGAERQRPRWALFGGPPGPSPLPTAHKAFPSCFLYLIVQKAGQLHFPSIWGDSEEVGIGATNPVFQLIIFLVPSYQPEGLGTWRRDKECPGSTAT